MAEPSVGRASVSIASGTLVSRLLGFISQILLWNTIGIVGSGGDAFAIANQLPNNIYAIVAGGTLSAIIVPQIVKALGHHDGGAAFLNRLMTLGLTVFLAVTVLATVFAPAVVWLYTAAGSTAVDPKAVALATAFAYWCLPQIFFYALYALTGEVLNARGVFGPYTWAPVANNIVMILMLLAFGAIFGNVAGLAPEEWTPGMIALLAGGATTGIATQAAVLLVVWRRAGIRYRPDFRWRGVGLGESASLAKWTFGMILVTQLAGIVETNVAWTATGDASVAAMSVAWLIFMLPHSIIAVSIAMPYFTRMSHHAAQQNRKAVATDLAAALRVITLLITFSAVGLAVIAMPFATIFSSSHTDATALTPVLWAYLLGLIAFSALHILVRGFYSLTDTRTPFLLQAGQSALVVISALVIVIWVPSQDRAIALALTLSIAGTLQTLLALLLMRRQLPELALRKLFLGLLWCLGAMVPAAGIGLLCLQLLGGTAPGAFPVTGFITPIISMAAIGIAMLITYFGMLLLTRNPVLRELIAVFRAR